MPAEHRHQPHSSRRAGTPVLRLSPEDLCPRLPSCPPRPASCAPPAQTPPLPGELRSCCAGDLAPDLAAGERAPSTHSPPPPTAAGGRWLACTIRGPAWSTAGPPAGGGSCRAGAITPLPARHNGGPAQAAPALLPRAARVAEGPGQRPHEGMATRCVPGPPVVQLRNARQAEVVAECAGEGGRLLQRHVHELVRHARGQEPGGALRTGQLCAMTLCCSRLGDRCGRSPVCGQPYPLTASFFSASWDAHTARALMRSICGWREIAGSARGGGVIGIHRAHRAPTTAAARTGRK